MHEAANLPPMDINGLADAYVLVKLKSRSDSTCEIIHKSELKLKTLSPVWNENLEKYIRAKEDFRIIFEGEISFKFISSYFVLFPNKSLVYDRDHFGSDEMIGGCSFG